MGIIFSGTRASDKAGMRQVTPIRGGRPPAAPTGPHNRPPMTRRPEPRDPR